MVNQTPNQTAQQTPSSRQTPRSRFTPRATAGLRLEERDEQLLCDLYQHRFMARGQLEALYFTSTVRCNARLRQLFDYSFVKRYYLPAAPYGAQAIYSIGKNAVPLVARRLEVEADEVARQQRGTRTPTFIEHTLEVVNIWLCFRAACAQRQDVKIERWLPEILCRHEYDITVNSGSHSGRWRKEAFKPDAFVRLASQGRFHNFFVEVDLGHTSSRQFIGKLLTHQRYLESGLFQEIYGGDEFHTLVITTGPRRLRNLRALVEQQNSHLFWLTTFEDARTAGLFGSIWHRGGIRQGALF
jgi:hypothetical protein